MFNRDDSIAANSAATASENFAGETVIIHFERGTYFSLRGSAGAVWSLLQAPTSIAAIVEASHALKAPAAETLEPMLTAFVARLAEEGLLAASPGPPTRPDISPEILTALAEPADLEVYSDLAELIAMDPVHEIDVLTGWPHLPEADHEAQS